jgi:hypothetical protein
MNSALLIDWGHRSASCRIAACHIAKVEGPLRVASGYSAHTSVRALQLAGLSLRAERQRCDGELTIRRARCQTSRV